MPRVVVIGSAGAGKSTFARDLGLRLGIDVIHLDHLYWRPGWVPTLASEWRAIQRKLVSRPSWVIDGNYGGTLDVRLRAADTVVFFDVPRRVALAGILRRWLTNRGREIQAPGCPERLDWSFLGWAWRYPRDSRPRVLAALRAHCSSAEVIVIRSRREAREVLGSARPLHGSRDAGQSSLPTS